MFRGLGLGLFACLSFALAGCMAPYPLVGHDPQVATQTIEVPVNEALILPEPGGPRTLSVLETRYINALEQEVVLATDTIASGQNAFHVVFFGPVPGRTGWSNFKGYDLLSTDAIDADMEAALPNVYMQRSGYFTQNRYGPFGYAIGRAGSNDLCIYAWQRIQSQVQLYAFLRDRGVMTVRYRMCQAGATESQLLRGMYRFSINGYFLPRSWQPYGRPMSEPEGIGRIGGPLAYPSGIEGDATVLNGVMGPEPAAAPRRVVRRAPAPRAPVVPAGPQKPSEPLPGYPMVPAPNQITPQASPVSGAGNTAAPMPAGTLPSGAAAANAGNPNVPRVIPLPSGNAPPPSTAPSYGN
ncbi:cellulose biosynthesis protein BcsN [Ancylobacter sp. 6x-1]|uniref:Cellulose biosynthesis protein BcsN n=1 Tax=Ancylobacter crimeensis TaxID=2579147 RepID=A0ABT0DBC5_9HYPH|nr:cellulose biosynthesis protein BcsN [Ancylobacter crimeensis]MCK0197199.1 cellulose biosynthesis protein BcsN [Ancylobacter crimeensis]